MTRRRAILDSVEWLAVIGVLILGTVLVTIVRALSRRDDDSA